MTAVCGWLSDNPHPEIAAIGRALQVHAAQEWAAWTTDGLAVGLLELPGSSPAQRLYQPAKSGDGRHALWLVGEAFHWHGFGSIPDPEFSRTLEFRAELLTAIVRCGDPAIRALNGEYLIVLWDRSERRLTLWNDRFASVPLYWARSTHGFGFASGVRGLMVCPGVSDRPDLEALREAVTFGGYRLGDRTNVADVKLMAPHTELTVRIDSAPRLRRYWSWNEIPAAPTCTIEDLAAHAGHLWEAAVGRRLSRSGRHGQTLSGGLDSRAILAEAGSRLPEFISVTYGVQDCDDVQYARQAASSLNVPWLFCPLYRGKRADWLERRSSYIHQTDGMLQLVDLMHYESLALQHSVMDVQLSGYLGDAVCGPSFDHVIDAPTTLDRMPFYGTELGWSYDEALSWVKAEIGALPAGTPARYFLYEHKLNQSIHKIFQGYMPWLRIRRPFLDYDLFDFFAAVKRRRLPDLYATLLRRKYLALFAGIPHQKTGRPVLTPNWRVQMARAGRFAWRGLQSGLNRVGVRTRIRQRSFHMDRSYWIDPEVRRPITETILRPGSFCCGVFGEAAAREAIGGWFEHESCPVEVVAAMYSYEHFHAELAAHTRRALTSRTFSPEPRSYCEL